MIDIARNARRLLVKKSLAWGFWGIHFLIIFGFWLPLGVPEITTGDLPTMLD